MPHACIELGFNTATLQRDSMILQNNQRGDPKDDNKRSTSDRAHCSVTPCAPAAAPARGGNSQDRRRRKSTGLRLGLALVANTSPRLHTAMRRLRRCAKL